ncbi:MAG: hypothetical protein HYX39_04940 [Bacteroidetes bacterium]|nr:hypothetical protein [Bacteroidota bacterium]
MRVVTFYFFIFFPIFLFQQNHTHYKNFKSTIGINAVTNNTFSAQSFSFTLPLYQVLEDTVSGNLFITTRQKDANGKGFTNKGYHLTINKNDSACCILEDSKLEIKLSGDNLIYSSETKSGKYNASFGYEQFEYTSKIISYLPENNSGLSYGLGLINDNDKVLKCIRLIDGNIIWTAKIPYKYNWNSVSHLNDSVLLIAAGGLHAININRGSLWSHSFITSEKSEKPFIYSSFNTATCNNLSTGITTSREEAQVNEIASNILVSDSLIYFASKNGLFAFYKTGNIKWQVDLSSYPVSKCILKESGNRLLLINLGLAKYKDNTVLYGRPFIAAFDKHIGNLLAQNIPDNLNGLLDVDFKKDAILLADKNKVIEFSEDLQPKIVADIIEAKFGKFIEFINGNDYFVEQKGIYMPLNRINEQVIYFKTDHGKVFGMNKSNIEYEYHFTELYKLNKTIGDKKLISQKNKSLLINPDSRILQTFNCGENALVIKNKIYFADGSLLHIIDLNSIN